MTASILKFPEPFAVARSIARIVTVGGAKFRIYTEDFRSPAECEAAMDSVLEFCRATSNPAPNWDSLADLIMIGLDVPKDAPWGCSIIAEPLDVEAAT